MKKLLALSALTLLLAGCGNNEPVENDSSLNDMLNTQTETTETETVEPTEMPSSTGPTEIPSDLIPNE